MLMGEDNEDNMDDISDEEEFDDSTTVSKWN